MQQGKYNTQNEKPPKDAGERGERGIPSPFPAHSSLVSTRRRRTARGPKVPSLSPPTEGCPAGPGRERTLGRACLPLAPVGFSQLRRPGQALGRAESRRAPLSACKPPRCWQDAGAASRGGERWEPARRREPGDGASPPAGGSGAEVRGAPAALLTASSFPWEMTWTPSGPRGAGWGGPPLARTREGTKRSKAACNLRLPPPSPPRRGSRAGGAAPPEGTSSAGAAGEGAARQREVWSEGAAIRRKVRSGGRARTGTEGGRLAGYI